jgi:hypothetical protein
MIAIGMKHLNVSTIMSLAIVGAIEAPHDFDVKFKDLF